jgi:hypothetical protein
MTKQQAMNIAKDLTKAVTNKLMTEKQAKKHFFNIAIQYKSKDRMKHLQKTNPRLWMKLCESRT